MKDYSDAKKTINALETKAKVTAMIRRILLEISKSLRKEEFENIKYLLKDEIGEGVLEKMKSPLQIFQKLEEQDHGGNKGISIIIELLKAIRREDLSEKLAACEYFLCGDYNMLK